jgi:predicted transposase YbfD/YdcC
VREPSGGRCRISLGRAYRAEAVEQRGDDDLSILLEVCSILSMDRTRIREWFAVLDDPRVERTRRHELDEILVITVLSVIAGADGWDDIVIWGNARLSWLRTFLKLENGIPSADTFRRVLCAIDPTAFAACFQRMIGELAGSMLDQLVAIDGKTMRRTFARERGQSPLHMVSAWLVERGVLLGQLATEAKSNEITAIPALLDTLNVRGATVSIDAEGCQKKIAEKIVDKGANYLLALKANQPLLHQEVVQYFEHARQDRTVDAKPLVTHETVDKGHGRLETRRAWCTDDVQWLSERTRWKGLRTIVMIERTRQLSGQTSVEQAYYISSHAPDAKRIGDLIRRHWSIENELHWVLDMTFDEDQSRIRDRNAATNLALLRKLALALLKREQSKPSMSIVGKRRRVGWDNDYLFTVLAASRKTDAAP